MIVPVTVVADPTIIAETPEAVSDADRLARIMAVLEPNWRPDEWDPAVQVLVPRFDDPFLRTHSRCKVSGCSNVAHVRTGLCNGCTTRFNASGSADVDEWVATVVADVRRRRLSGDSCRVARRGKRCPRRRKDPSICAPPITAAGRSNAGAVPTSTSSCAGRGR